MIDAGRDSADAHGLTTGKSAGDLLNAAVSGDLASHVAQVAKDALNAGEGAVRKEV